MKTMIVTGAGGGLGEQIALRASQAGYRVGLVDVDEQRVKAAAARIPNAVGYRADTSSEADVEAVLDQFGEVPDVLVNNAGIVRFGPLLEQSAESFKKVVEVNLIGCFISAKAVARRMVGRGSGSIINITSINAVHPGPGAGAYPASKAAVASLTQHMSLEWAPAGLRINAIAPGFIDAGMSAPIYADPKVRKLRGGAVPQRRLGVADDIANAVLFLASEQAAYINGHELVVDGGVVNSILMQLPRD
ncbi:SDR family NAD(P)-dependent oxidoreductase [Peristeroidobacter soli]|jgi:NAD(P)-dependent dehydrogenase (short-subunit alcohol dehydrogenase family)|uniref:SDR family NAD(P)-dependent oxidoreductase n=1 Tax=Peristeroidobacter soli TaxID=2497877 RepID=UPI00101D0817|nr:SDR family NAD(P)-dependent oxidoreductase [Peristeroidobacter soli]